MRLIRRIELAVLLLDHAAKDDWADGRYWLLWALVGSLLPLLIAMLFYIGLAEGFSLSVFSRSGEFALYSASFAASASYIVIRGKKRHPGTFFPSQQWLIAILSLSLIFVSLIYSGQLLGKLMGLKVFTESFVMWTTVPTFTFVVLLAFLITVADRAIIELDVDDWRKRDRQKLDRDFEETE